MPELAEIIRNLSPGALAIFKRQLASLPQSERDSVYQRLYDIPELADITGTPALKLATRQKQPEQELGLRQIPGSNDIPLWKKGLAAFAWPFQQIQEKAISLLLLR